MNRHRLTLAAALLAAAYSTSAMAVQPTQPSERASLEHWRSYTGVTWAPANEGGNVAADASSVNAPIVGIHFDLQGRAFVSTPRVLSADAPATLSVLDTRTTSGPARLTAFPSTQDNAVAGAPDQHLRNVLGFYIDRRNGWLWALDQGFVAGESEAPEGAQKIMVYALDTGRLVKRIGLDAVADRKGSFLNDIVVDEARKVAYVSDSGLRSAPANQAGLIVVDFTSGRARRLLDRHPSLLSEPGAKVMSHGTEVWPGKPLVLGINGIALSPDARTLYWTVTTGQHAHAIATHVLRNPKANRAEVAAAVHSIGDVGGNTDGIVTDADGRLYITDVTRNGIVRYDPATKAMTLVAADDGISWPDTPTIAPDGALVVTSSRLNLHFAGAVKAGEERYDLWRLPLNPSPQQGASK
ncbi:L-dopachrome tautomerase-related protein (plasmid) [Ralstonia sp. 25C]|uniref:L-dopachrome tautomerase-related protein n=1 Tax=Ralstonia sp. 25C TaxID=3447363 RepID=UPI003F74B688